MRRIRHQLSKQSIFAITLFATTYILGSLSLLKALLNGGDPWRFGDWLINYNGGFVRRGLFGTLLYALPTQGTAILFIVFMVQVFLYGYVFWNFTKCALGKSVSWKDIAILCSPAAICFVGWDVNSFGRKEILGFATLFFLKNGNRGHGLNQQRMILATIFFIGAIFASEVNFVFLPSFTILMYQNAGTRKLNFTMIIISVITFFGFLLQIYNTGSRNIAGEICRKWSIEKHLSDNLCRGSIDALGSSIEDSLNNFVSLGTVRLPYLLLLATGLIPLVSSKWAKKNKIYLVSTLVFSMPLYVVAVDYGRWIYMTITQLSICYFSEENRHEKQGTFCKTLVYTLTWGIPQTVISYYSFVEYMGFFPAIVRYFGRI